MHYLYAFAGIKMRTRIFFGRPSFSPYHQPLLYIALSVLPYLPELKMTANAR
jgi:hypothetical protein